MALAGQSEPEFDDPDPVRGWAAQYLNVWPSLMGAGTTILPNWDRLATSPPAEGERTLTGLGVAVDPDQTWLSLGAVLEGELPHLAPVLRYRMTEQDAFVAEVDRISNEYGGIPVVIDAKGPAAFLIKPLELLGVPVERIGLDDFAEATAFLVGAVAAGEVEHGDYDDLNDALAAAGWRKVGDRRVFARRGGDISMLEAVTLAAWLVTSGAADVNAW